MKLETFITNNKFRKQIVKQLYRDTLKGCNAFKDTYSTKIVGDLIKQTYNQSFLKKIFEMYKIDSSQYFIKGINMRENFILGRSMLLLFRSANLDKDENQIKKILRIAHNWSFYIRTYNSPDQNFTSLNFSQKGEYNNQLQYEDNIEGPDNLSSNQEKDITTDSQLIQTQNQNEINNNKLTAKAIQPWQRILQQSKQYQKLEYDKQLFVHSIIEKCIEPTLSTKKYKNLAEYLDDKKSENTESRLDNREQYEVEEELIEKIQNTPNYSLFLSQIFHLEKSVYSTNSQKSGSSEVYNLLNEYDFILPFQFPTEIEDNNVNIQKAKIK